MKRRICAVSGSRADYGLLRWTLKEIHDDSKLELYLVVTGSHLLAEYGSSVNEIEADSIPISGRIDVIDPTDSAQGVARAIGAGVVKFSETFSQLEPDLLLLLGDRYEIFSAAVAATALHIPIAHCHGGERTEGAMDEALRHSITKMAHIHFTATNQYKDRVIQLGEHPEHVFNVGSFGVEAVQRFPRLTQPELETKLNLNLSHKTLFVAYHPETHSPEDDQQTLANLFRCLNELNQVKVIFSLSNADEGGRGINELINEYVNTNSDKASVFANLGQEVLFSLLENVDGIVGNSSSGIIEAPSLKVGTLNIGNRQKGRIRADSIIDCRASCNEISRGLAILLSKEFKERVKQASNPYEGQGPSKKVRSILRSFPLDGILRKAFYDISANG